MNVEKGIWGNKVLRADSEDFLPFQPLYDSEMYPYYGRVATENASDQIHLKQ
jgi:hypothetical protein